MKNRFHEVVGLIPAAGHARRIAPMPCSKELYPLGFSTDSELKRPKVVSHYLLEKMRRAGVTRVYLVLREGKWDIPAYFGDGTAIGMQLAYLMMGLPYGVPFTLDQAYPFVRQATVVFGFPDILFDADDAFLQLLSKHSELNADVTLGLFPVSDSSKEDTVDLSENGMIQDLILRPSPIHLTHSWGIAAWSSTFTEFLHGYVGRQKAWVDESKELTAGHVVKAAIEEGLRVCGISVSAKPYLDIGTPEDLIKAVKSSLT